MKIIFTRLSLFFLSFVGLLSYQANAQAPTDLLISEYVEGSSNNKAIELFNGTGSPINLTAGNYVIQYFFNGSSTAGSTINLTGTVPANGVFVLAQASASFAGAAYVNQTSSASWYNGDDAVVLKKGGTSGTILDAIGQVGVDPGTEWGAGLTSTADNTLRRKAGDCTGDINVSDAYDPSVKFDGFATDDFTGLGSHTSTCVSSSSISLSVPSLTFTTVVGTPSTEKTYTVQGNSLTNDITVTAPSSSFGISLTTGGPYTTTLTITAAAANAAPVSVFTIFNPASAGVESGSITHVSGTTTANLGVQGNGLSSTTTKISTIQGSGAISPLTGQIVITRGIVIGKFDGPAGLGGFFIQEPDTSQDGNPATSEGIFVFTNTGTGLSVGDDVFVIGTVAEAFGKTELTTVTSITTFSTGNPLPAPVTITLPVPAVTDLEKYEGMLVQFPQMLTATETFTLGRFGEVLLSSDGRLFNPTNFVDPNDDPASGTTSAGNSNVAAVTAQQNLNFRRSILLDDGSNVQNPPIVPYLNPADTTLRIGSTVMNLTGVMDFDFSEYRIQPTVAPVFSYAPRPGVPSVGSGNIKVGSFNVLNYFNGDGMGGGFPTPRGANTLTEFNRQRVKIIGAIDSLNPDLLGLTEIENDGDGPTSAIADIVNGLNAITGAGTYAYIADPTGVNGNTGTDAIKVAFIYKPSKVTPSGPSKADITPVHNRPPLAQTFTVNSSGEKFTAIIVHFKSKSCTDAAGADADQLDGQGCYNDRRRLQANALLTFIANLQSSSGDSDIISLGDYNSYEEEDPLDILRAGGLTGLLPGAYSYVFDGQSGSLDHGFVNSTIASHVTGAAKWHINSDEPIIKDYNQEFNPPYTYSPDVFRSSDHDPVLVGLQLANLPPVVTITSPTDGATYPAGSTITMHVDATDSDGTITHVDYYANGLKVGTGTTAPYEITGTDVEGSTYLLTAKAFDDKGDSTVSDTVHITVSSCSGSGSLSVYGYLNIPGTGLINLASDPDYPNNPDIVTTLSSFEYGPNIADNYGGRVRGYICAPKTGNYVFYLASDDQSELWLSTDDNPNNIQRIAYVENKVGFHKWFATATQKSAPIHLVKGARYYIETVHKEGTGSDHLSVGWVLPGGLFQAPIPGANLSPFATTPPVGTRGGSFEEQMRATVKGLIVKATPNPSESNFTLTTRSNRDDRITITVTDVLGRVIEKRMALPANGTIQFGANYIKGVYLVEVAQGTEKQRLKLIRQ